MAYKLRTKGRAGIHSLGKNLWHDIVRSVFASDKQSVKTETYVVSVILTNRETVDR